MKKKVLITMLSVVVAIFSMVGLTSCDGGDYSAHAHTVVKVDEKSATCTEKGNIAYYKCEECGKLFSDETAEKEITEAETVAAAKGHKIIAVAEKAAKCDENGNIAHFECEACGKLFFDKDGETEITEADVIVPKSGHTMAFHAEISSTCTENGTKEYYECDKCGKKFVDENGKTEITETIVPALGHDMIFRAEIPATCTEDGNVSYYECDVCGKYFEDESGETELTEIVKLKTGHAYKYVDEIPKTCDERGVKAHYECTNVDCGEKFVSDGEEYKPTTDKELIIPASHDNVFYAAKAETCTTDGNTEYYVCSTCNKYFADENGNTEIEKDSWVIKARHVFEKTLSHDETSHWYACANCDEKKDETAHAYGDATFNAIGGIGTQTCAVCTYEAAVTDSNPNPDFTKSLYGAVAYANADNEKKAINDGAAKNSTDYKTRFGFEISNGAIGYVVPAYSAMGVTEACFPKINYSAFTEVSLKVIMRATGNDWKLGLDVTDMKTVSMPSANGNYQELAMSIKYEDGTLIVTIKTDASTTLTKTITDENVINGLVSVSIFVSGTYTNGVEISDFTFKKPCEEHTFGDATVCAIGKTVQTCSVCGYEKYQNAEVGELDFTANKFRAKAMWQVNGEFTLHDGAVKSSTELSSGDGTITKDSLAYIAAASRLYEDYLPRINFAAFKKVTINFSVQKNTDNWKLGLSADNVVQITDGTGKATLTFEMQGDKLVQTLTVNGTTYTKEITDESVINGDVSATFFVQDVTGRGVFYLSDFTFTK